MKVEKELIGTFLSQYPTGKYSIKCDDGAREYYHLITYVPKSMSREPAKNAESQMNKLWQLPNFIKNQ